MTKTTKVTRPTVADCEVTLRALDLKRAALVARGEKLPELRRDAAFAAHVEKDPEARKALDRVAAEVASYETERREGSHMGGCARGKFR
jgi:hypothetical protein